MPGEGANLGFTQQPTPRIGFLVQTSILEDANRTLFLSRVRERSEPQAGLRLHPEKQGALPPRLPHTPPTTERIRPRKGHRRLCPNRQEKHGRRRNQNPDSSRKKR